MSAGNITHRTIFLIYICRSIAWIVYNSCCMCVHNPPPRGMHIPIITCTGCVITRLHAVTRPVIFQCIPCIIIIDIQTYTIYGGGGLRKYTVNIGHKFLNKVESTESLVVTSTLLLIESVLPVGSVSPVLYITGTGVWFIQCQSFIQL